MAGCKLVPLEPTEEMYLAFCEARGVRGSTYKDGLRAAIKAALDLKQDSLEEELEKWHTRAIAAEELLDAGPSFQDGSHKNQYLAEIEVLRAQLFSFQEPEVWGWHWLERIVGGKWDGEELNSGTSIGPRKPEFLPSTKALATEHVYTALYTIPTAITLQQVQKAYDYATDHPDKYSRGTTNWCAAVAHSLNEQLAGAGNDE